MALFFYEITAWDRKHTFLILKKPYNINIFKSNLIKYFKQQPLLKTKWKIKVN